MPKAKAMKPSKEEIEEIIKEKRKLAAKKQDLKNKQKEVDRKRKELQFMINGRIVDKIQMQNDIRASFLNLMKMSLEIKEVEKQLDTGKITIQWNGIPMPKDMLAVQHDILVHNYKLAIAEFKYKEQQLKNMGFSEEKIEAIVKEGRIFGEDNEGDKNDKRQYIG